RIAVNVANMGIFNALLSIFRNAALASREGGVSDNAFMQWLLKYARLANITAAPAAIYIIGSSLQNLIAGPYDERLDSLLNTAEGVAWLGDIVAAFGRGLNVAQLIPDSQVLWI